MTTADIENVPTNAVTENVTEDSLSTSTSQELDRQIRLLEDTVKEFRSQISNLKRTKKEIVSLEKENTKLTKKKAKKASTGNRKGGFSQPTEISDELAGLLGVESGSALPRSEVTKMIGAYVREHQLLNPENRRNFLLNDTAESKALEALLDSESIYRNDAGDVMVRSATEGKDDQALGYFNLQKCIKQQFGKTLPAIPEAAAEAPVAEAKVEAPAKKVVKKVAKKSAPVTEEAAPAATKKVVKKKIVRKKK